MARPRKERQKLSEGLKSVEDARHGNRLLATLYEKEIKKYLGNPKLRNEGAEIHYTKRQLEELKLCMNDPVYFMKTYMKIIHVDRGLVNFVPYDFQEKLVYTFRDNRFVACLCPRQVGKSITTVAFILWYALFNGYKTIAILANKGATARQILQRLQLAYYNLPLWLQQGVVVWNKSSIELENGTKIIAASTTSDSIRGESISLCFIDECAFIPTTKYHEFMTSTYPTISSGKETRMIMVSTPNGMNHYYDIWQKAVKKESKYVPFQINWWDVPGRDEAWKAEVIANTSEEQFAQEFGNQFIGSSSTLLSNDVLERLDIHDPIYSNKNIRIYEEPTLGHDYMIVADCADGGEDNSACTVFDITQKPFKQVATFYGRISHLLYPAILAQLGIKYNECPILVERNDIGKTILHILNYDLEYPNIINTRQGGKVRMGITTTAGNRLVACSRLKDMIEKGLLKIVDKNSIFELYNFVWTGKRYEADTGYHDDSVMGLALFSYYVNTPQFTMRYDMEMRAEFLKKAEEEMYENLTPLPLFNDWCDAHPQGLSDEDRDWLLS